MKEEELLKEINDLISLVHTNKLEARCLKKSDWDILVSWWEWWKWPVMPKEFLPENGTGGIMIEKNNIPIIAGFLYETNSEVAILEWVISNPKYKGKDRMQAIELLITEVEKRTKELGYKYMFSIGRNKHLVSIHEKLGWSVDKRNSHEITKKIK